MPGGRPRIDRLSVRCSDGRSSGCRVAWHVLPSELEKALARTDHSVTWIDGVLAWLDCEVAERIDGGDHTIYVGRVVAVEIARPDAQPLIFYGGRYRSLQPGS